MKIIRAIKRRAKRILSKTPTNYPKWENAIGVQLEVTTRCNANCAFCPRADVIKSGKRKLADIEIKALNIILQKLNQSSYKIAWISISGMGEPLMYKDIIPAIKAVKRTFPSVPFKVNTNALKLQDWLVVRLVYSGLDKLVCSLNVARPADFEDIKRIDYATVQQNIIKFLEYKGNNKPVVFIRVNAFDANIPHIKDAREFWKPYLNKNDRFSMGRFSNWAGKIERTKFVKHELTTKRNICKFFTDERVIAINVDGDVFPCCVAIAETSESALCLGNLKDSSLDELYNSEKMRNLIELHKQGKYPSPCDKCDSWGAQVENMESFK